MKNNSKSRLSIKRMLFIVVAIVVFAAIQLIAYKKEDIVSITANIEDSLLIDVKEVSEDTIEIASMYHRNNDDITSRSSTLERESVSQDYINIEDIKKEMQEKCIDTTPTNGKKYISINEVKISVDMDLTQRCGLSKEDFKILMNNLKTDTTGFFKQNSDTIYDVCEKYEINEIFFVRINCRRIRLEYISKS